MRRNPPRRHPERGSALPVVLALTIGVGALSTGYAMRNVREHEREKLNRHSTEALYQAWAQMEVVAQMVRTSDYDASGRNRCLLRAIARDDDQFIDPDGWPTGVVATELGAGSGFFELNSTATVRGASRSVTSLVRERRSFADYNYFVNSHPLGISGGREPDFPFVDAPEGSIHSNDRLIFYFADRHFRDPVTAVNGFEYTAGARGKGDPDGENTFFHGPVNDSSRLVEGLMDVDVPAFGARPDTLLALDGEYDFARVKLLGARARVEHWEAAHFEDREVTTWVERFHYEQQDQWVDEYEWRLDRVRRSAPIYEQSRTWTSRMDSVKVLVSPGHTTYSKKTRKVKRKVFVTGGGGGDTGGGGSGAVGYWTEQWFDEEYDAPTWHPPVYRTEWQEVWYWRTDNVYVGERVWYEDVWVRYATGEKVNQPRTVRVTDGWDPVVTIQPVLVPERLVEVHDLAADGSIYVRGDVHFSPVTHAADGQDTHVLDGSLTVASDGDVYVHDSIVYGSPDSDGRMQTAYLNGDDPDEPYVPNPDYPGSSVLGIVARDSIVYTSNVPDHTEINATLLAKEGEVRVSGVQVNYDGSVAALSEGAFVKMSLRRLGGMTTNRRPVSAFVDSSNAVTRGFVHGKSVYDRRQLSAPPRGFPTLNQPRILAQVMREVK